MSDKDLNEDCSPEMQEAYVKAHYDDKEQEMRSMLKFNELFGNSKSSLISFILKAFTKSTCSTVPSVFLIDIFFINTVSYHK